MALCYGQEANTRKMIVFLYLNRKMIVFLYLNIKKDSIMSSVFESYLSQRTKYV